MSGTTKQQAMALAIVKQMEGDGFIFANPKQAACVALAAIMETQRLDAELAEARFAEGGWDAGHSNAGIIIGGYIRSGEHYAAIGGGRG